MPNYRLYLIGHDKSISAAEHFAASGDGEACELASALHNTCNEAFPDYELWAGARRLGASQTLWVHKDISELRADLQRRVAELEGVTTRFVRNCTPRTVSNGACL